MLYMAKRALPLRIDEGLLARVDGEAERLGQTRTKFVERALELALSVTDSQPLEDLWGAVKKSAPSVGALEKASGSAGDADRTGIPVVPAPDSTSSRASKEWPPVHKEALTPDVDFRRDPSRVPGVVRASDLAKRNVRPIPKGSR